jgi:integrase
VIFLAATTGLRRAEICGLRTKRDLDWERSEIKVGWSIVQLGSKPPEEIPTKNRRVRRVALDEASAARLRKHLQFMEDRAAAAGASLDATGRAAPYARLTCPRTPDRVPRRGLRAAYWIRCQASSVRVSVAAARP